MENLKGKQIGKQHLRLWCFKVFLKRFKVGILRMWLFRGFFPSVSPFGHLGLVEILFKPIGWQTRPESVFIIRLLGGEIAIYYWISNNLLGWDLLPIEDPSIWWILQLPPLRDRSDRLGMMGMGGKPWKACSREAWSMGAQVYDIWNYFFHDTNMDMFNFQRRPKGEKEIFSFPYVSTGTIL